MMRFLTRRSVQVILLLALLAGAVWASGTERGWLQRLQYFTFDTFNRVMPRAASDGVVVVDIDEESLAKLGQWPWPRDVMGRLVDRLKAMGAASVAFDIVFAEADRTDPATVAQRLPEGSIERLALSILPNNDMVFADAIRNAGNVVTSFIWSNAGNEGKVPAVTRGMIMAKPARETLLAHAKTAPHIVTTLPVLEKAAAGNGSFSVSTDVDGIVRKVPLVLKFTPDTGGGARLYPALSLEALRVAIDKRSSIQIVPAPQKTWMDTFQPAFQVKIGSLRIPMEKDGQIWVYYAPAKPQQYVSAASVINGTARADAVRGRIVLVGTSAEGLKDIRSSPLDLFVPGVEMHANIVAQALEGKFLSRPALATGIEAVFIFATGLLVIILTPFVNVFVLFAAVIALVFGAFGASWWAFTHAGLLIDPVYPSLAVAVLFILSSLLSYLKSETERREIRGAFGLYISPDFMAELTDNPDKLKLGGEIKDLTVMFTDIRNFTTIAEGMTPQVLINTMNDFLTPMSDAVMQARGTIDKYMGDAMMAFWNAPLDVADHERLAVEAALRMRSILAPVNEKLKAQADAEGRMFHPLNCGIGINTGPVAVGNMGSRQRFAYSALGDAVNLASRLEGQTKAYGVNLLIGAATAEKVMDFAILDMDDIRVKGKREPVRIFTVLGDAAMAQSQDFITLKQGQTAFITAWRSGAFEAAGRLLVQARKNDRDAILKGYYEMFAERLAAIKAAPPEHWDGVFEATSK